VKKEDKKILAADTLGKKTKEGTAKGEVSHLQSKKRETGAHNEEPWAAKRCPRASTK